MIARSPNVKGEPVNKIEWLPHIEPWLQHLPNGTCLLCECYWPGNEGSSKITSILGCLKEKAIARQEKSKLHLYVFDIMAWGGANYINTPFIERVAHLKKFRDFYLNEYIQFATYYEGQELWDKLQDYLASGREGMVIMRKDAIVYNKRTPARVSIKIKKELQETIDVVVLGANAPTRAYTGKDIESWTLWENIVTGERLEGALYEEYRNGATIEPVTSSYFFNRAGSFVIGVFNPSIGKYIPIGNLGGLTNEMAENWKSYVGKVVEVTGMEIFKDDQGNFSGIRHPKMIAIRSDKNSKECLMEQLL